MPMYQDNMVRINGGILVWDGMSRPDVKQGQGGEQIVKRSLKVVIPPNHPDIQLLDQLANKCLAESKWRGQLPANGRMPIGTATPNEFNGMFPGWSVVNASTFFMPDVYDENGAPLTDPMQYSQKLFNGQRVDILVMCKEYDNQSKGIAARLQAFCIAESENAQPINIGGGADTAGAFGGGQQQFNQQPQQQQYQQPQQQQYQAPQQQYQQPQQQQYQQPQQQQYQAPQQQQYQGPNAAQDQQYQQSPQESVQYSQQPQQNQDPGAAQQQQQYPQQANNFLPGQQ